MLRRPTTSTLFPYTTLFRSIVSNNSKRIVLLKDIAAISINDAKEYIKINANGRESLLLAIIKQPNANLGDLSMQMEKQVDRKSTRLNSSHTVISYAVFCLKK